MAAVANRIWYFVFGGVFTGFWLWYLFFPETAPDSQLNVAAWFLWGIVGLALAGGAFAGRMTSGPAQASIWVVTGIAASFVVASWIYEPSGHTIATVFTAAGGFLIASGIQTMGEPEPPRPARPQPPHQAPPTGGDWQRSPDQGQGQAHAPPEQYQQAPPGQQQSVTVVRGNR